MSPAIRHAVERLRHGLPAEPLAKPAVPGSKLPGLHSTVTAILARAGGGARKISGVDDQHHDAVLQELRVALPLHLATIGPVLPIRRYIKRPWIGAWQKVATCDPVVIRQWASKFPDCNWGITQNVIDVDSKGELTWMEILAKHNDSLEPEALTAVTPTGGLHIYIHEPLPTGTNTLGPGIDTRGFRSGMVVAPGSYVKQDAKEKCGATGFYKWERTGSYAAGLAPINSVPWATKIVGEVRAAIDRGEKIERDPMIPLELAEEMLKTVDPANYQEQGAWFAMMCSFHFVTGGQGGVYFVDWSLSDTTYPGRNDDIQNRWDSLGFHTKGDADEHLFYDAVRAAGREDLAGRAVWEEFGEPDMPPPTAADKRATLRARREQEQRKADLADPAAARRRKRKQARMSRRRQRAGRFS